MRKFLLFQLELGCGEDFLGWFVDSNVPELLALEVREWFHWTTIN